MAISEEEIKRYFDKEGIQHDEAILKESWRFLLFVSSEKDLYNEIVLHQRGKDLKRHDDKVNDLKRLIGNDFFNIKAITIHTKKGPVKFKNNAVPTNENNLLITDNPLFNVFLKKGHKPYEQEFTFPFPTYPMPDKDQFFYRIVDSSKLFGSTLFSRSKERYPKQKKAEVKKIILGLLDKFYPEVTKRYKIATMDKAFEKKLFPFLTNLDTQ